MYLGIFLNLVPKVRIMVNLEPAARTYPPPPYSSTVPRRQSDTQ
eukprot:SAG31_NODE_1460_length_8241_cov_11.816352_10_plen_44_part_00